MALGAATMALAFVMADRQTGRRVLIRVVTLGVGLNATAFIYPTEIYPEFPGALALVLSLVVVTRERALSVEEVTMRQ